MSENGSDHKEAVQNANLDVEDAIKELRDRPESKLEGALSVYFGVQEPAWLQYQDVLVSAYNVWNAACFRAYAQHKTQVASAWETYQDVSQVAWDTYRSGVGFYDNKLRFIKHYTWQMYITDTSVVWSRYSDATKPAYLDYCKAESAAQHHLACVTTDATLKYKREARAAWTKYHAIESPAWADLQQVRKELRSAPDLSLERFEE